MQLDQHIKVLNNQINELVGKIKVSSIQHSESEDKLAALQSTITTMEHVRFDLSYNKCCMCIVVQNLCFLEKS